MVSKPTKKRGVATPVPGSRRAKGSRPAGPGGRRWFGTVAESSGAPLACVVVALTVRVWAIGFQPWVTVDGTEYIRFAESLLRGQAFSSIFPPGYPALIALARLVVTDRVLAAGIVSLVCGALLPWPVWLLARRAVGARWALVPALVVALHPGLVLYSVVTMSESGYFLALYGALALTAACRGLGSGLAMGAAFAVRPEALLPAAALAAREAGLAVAEVRRSGPATEAPRAPGRGAGRLRTSVLVAIGFLVVALPCWIYFRTTLGEWTLTPKVAAAIRTTGATWREDEPRLGEAGETARYGTIARLVRHGPDALRRYPRSAVQYTGRLLDQWPAPLLLLSLWGFSRRRGIETLPLLQLLVLPLLALSVQDRFVLGVIPGLAILAAGPLATKPRWAWGAGALLWLWGATWCGFRKGPDLMLPLDGHLATNQQAGEWLGRVAEPGAQIMDRKPYVAFYADRPRWVMPDEPIETLIAEAQRQGVRYMVLDEGVIRVFRPQLLPLLFDATVRDQEKRLEAIYLGGRVKGYSLAIFRVLGPGERRSGKPPHVDLRWIGKPAPVAPGGGRE